MRNLLPTALYCDNFLWIVTLILVIQGKVSPCTISVVAYTQSRTPVNGVLLFVLVASVMALSVHTTRGVQNVPFLHNVMYVHYNNINKKNEDVYHIHRARTAITLR